MKALSHLLATSSTAIALVIIFAISPIVTVACSRAAARKVLERSIQALKQGEVHRRVILVDGRELGLQSHFKFPETNDVLVDVIKRGNFIGYEKHVCVEAMKSQPLFARHRGKIGLAAGLAGGAILGGSLTYVLALGAVEGSVQRHADKVTIDLSKD